MKTIFEKYLPVFEADGAGGGTTLGATLAPSGGGAGSAAGGAGGGAGPSGGATVAPIGGTGAEPGSGGWKAPEFLPEHLRGKDVNETFAKVADDWKAFRDRFAQQPQPGRETKDYAFTPSEKAAPFLAKNIGADPVMQTAQAAALKAQLSPKQFSEFIGSFYDTLAEGGKLPTPYSPERERDALVGPDARFMSEEQKVEAIRPMLQAGVDFLDGLRRTGAISPESFTQLAPLLDTAQGAKTIAALAKAFAASAPKGVNMGGDAAGSRQVTAADLRARQKDPRNDPNSGSFDRGFRDETLETYKKFYG